MSMPEFELPDAKTPSRKSGTSCILRRPFSILLRYAHTTNSPAPAWRAAPTRSHSPSPWSDSAPGPNAPQGRPPAPAPGQSTGGETASRAQAPGLARPGKTPVAPANAGVGDDRPRAHEHRPDLHALPRSDGSHRPDRGNHRRHRVRRARQPVDVRDRPHERRDRGASGGARVRAQSRGRVRIGDRDRRNRRVRRGAAKPRAGAEGRGLRKYTVLAPQRVRALPEDRATWDDV